MSGCGVSISTTLTASSPPSSAPSPVPLASQTISFTTNAPAVAAYNSQFTVAASASSGLPVSFTSSGACTNSGPAYTITSAPGTCSVIASQPGNATYSAAPQAEQTVSALTLAQAFPVFPVSRYGASGSSQSFTCTGQVNTNILSCTQSSTDFVAGQGIRIAGGGGAPFLGAITAPVTITRHGTQAGQHTYCYIAYVADAFGGITSGSPPSCASGEPELSFPGVYNSLSGNPVYPLNATLWYRSLDSGPYRLIAAGNGAQDVGQQPDSNGGWSDSLPADGSDISKNEDLFAVVLSVHGGQIALSVPLISAVSNTRVGHDDTAAIQSAIDAAVAAGGGIVSFGNGTFNVRRPTFIILPSPQVSTLLYSQAYVTSTWVYLILPKGSTGNVFFQGNDAATVIVTPPSYDESAILFGLGVINSPAWPPSVPISMEEVAKDETTVVLAEDPGAANVSPGTDIWLYSGSFDQNSPCVDRNGNTYGNCHFSELNTVIAVHGRTLTLAYPTSKRYYDDGASSFGLVVLPTTPHNIAIQDITFNTSSPIVGSGLVYGLLIDHVTINRTSGSTSVFGGGPKRDVLIENSIWSFGRSDGGGWCDEYDQFTNLKLVNNRIMGYAAPGMETESLMARLYMSEGTSGVTLQENTLDHASIYIDQTTDDVIEGNLLLDGILTLGDAYHPTQNPLAAGGYEDTAYVSFDSQKRAAIEGNTFIIDSDFAAPWIMRVGHFEAADIGHNDITENDVHPLAAILANGGTISRNFIAFGSLASADIGVAIYPDEAPDSEPAAFNVTANTITAASANSGIYVTDPGFSDTAPVCIQGNLVNIGLGIPVFIQNAADIVQTCQ